MKRKKRNPHIVYIITKLELGGAQKICLSLLQGMPQYGFASSLISGSGGILSQQLKNNDETVFLLDSFKREVSGKALIQEIKNFFSLVALLRKLKKVHANLIVHTHSTKAGLIGRWAAFFTRIPTRVHTVHGFAFHEHQSWSQWLVIYFLEFITSFITTHFVCVSSYDVKKSLTLFPFFQRKHSIIRAATHDDFYNTAPKTIEIPSVSTPFVFGTIACFKPQKNIFDLLEAFLITHQKHPHARLEIVGDGHLRAAIEQWITTHELAHVILLHGWQPNVIPFMNSWHAFVLSSLWEGLPCAIVEARLLKLPVISYNTGGISDVIIHQSNGLLYPQKNISQLAQGMSLLIQDPVIYNTLQNYPDNLKDFKIATMLEQHKALYTHLGRTTY